MGVFYLGYGTVQCYILRPSPFFMHHFGRAQYDRRMPILSASIKAQAQPIVDALNTGEMELGQAVNELNKITW